MSKQPTIQDLQDRIKELEAQIKVGPLQHPTPNASGMSQQGNLLFSLLQSLPFSIFAKDLEGRFVFANTCYCQTQNLSPEMIIGSKDTDLFPEVLASKHQADDRKVKEKRESVSYEEENQSISGQKTTTRVIKSPIYDSRPIQPEQKELLGILGIFWDITQQRVAEEERRSLEIQLIQAQKLEALGIFAGGIAHDFNNVLFLISGYTDLALNDLKKDLNPTIKLTKIKEASQRAGNLVQQIQSFARHTRHEREPLDISVVVKEVTKLLRSALPSTVTIKSTIPGDIACIVIANPSEIHQILMNLCTNADQAMAGRNGTLTITLENFVVDSFFALSHPGLQPGPHILLAVSDTGTGMTREVKSRIFEPFFTTKPQGQGSGLGLSVLHGIVAAMGGAVSVMSERGHGATFQVYLPLVSEENAAGQGTELAIRRGCGQKIMVVDDEPDILEMLTGLLNELNYSPTSFANPFDALERFSKNPAAYDLLLTDQTMPGMTGMELSKGILKIRPDIPVVLCTGFSQNVRPEDALQAGIREYLRKPILQAKLSTTLAAILSRDSD